MGKDQTLDKNVKKTLQFLIGMDHKPKIRLKSLRQQAALTQEALAKKLSVSRQSIIAIESGECYPSLPLTLELARFFNINIEDLFDWPGSQPVSSKKLISKKGGQMSSIIPWSPLQEMREAIDRLMDETSLLVPSRSTFPALNVHQTDKEVVVEAHVPGYKEDELEVEIGDGVLTLSGKTEEEKEEKDKQYLHREWSSESFTRSITLPENVDENKVEAGLKDGVLTITLQKLKAEKPKVKKIRVGRK